MDLVQNLKIVIKAYMFPPKRTLHRWSRVTTAASQQDHIEQTSSYTDFVLMNLQPNDHRSKVHTRSFF